jgi:hypothetical protein
MTTLEPMNQLAPTPARIADDRSTVAAFDPDCSSDAGMLETAAWQIECVGFVAEPVNKLVGYARLRLPGGMVIHGARVFRTPEGLRIGSPEIARRYDPDGRWTSSRAFNFPDQADWVRFSVAAIAAIERAYPGALAHPDTTTPTKD